MSAHRSPSIDQLPYEVSGSSAYGWWGMVWLIATEAMMFAALLAAYFYIRFKWQVEWPPEGIEKPELGLVLTMSVILWSSSVPVHLADRGIRKGNQKLLGWGMAVAAVLGSIFLFMQFAIEWPETLDHFTPRTNAYGSLFYTITGLHGAHVAVGIVMLIWTSIRGFSGHFDRRRHLTVQNVAMYWHFVDVVWIAVLLSLYLSPHV